MGLLQYPAPPEAGLAGVPLVFFKFKTGFNQGPDSHLIRRNQRSGLVVSVLLQGERSLALRVRIQRQNKAGDPDGFGVG